MSEPPFRVLPRLTERNTPFWTSGRDGVLRMQRCHTDGTWIHPPQPVCPSCFGKDLGFADLSGRAVVHTFTVNHQPWMPGPEPPYVVAIVELVEQAGLRLTTNLVDVAPEDVRIGMPVHVVFEAHAEGVHLPLFAPDPDGGA